MHNGDAAPNPATMTLTQRVDFYGNLLAGLVARAESEGVVVTVERVSRQPPAMGNHFPRVHAHPSHAARLQEERARALILAGAQ